MKKVMRVVAVALMLAGTTAFAGEGTCKGKKAECKKRAECKKKAESKKSDKAGCDKAKSGCSKGK